MTFGEELVSPTGFVLCQGQPTLHKQTGSNIIKLLSLKTSVNVTCKQTS